MPTVPVTAAGWRIEPPVSVAVAPIQRRAATAAEELAECEALLVDKALMLTPRKLSRAARRVLAPLRKRVEVHLPDGPAVVDPETGELLDPGNAPDHEPTEVELSDLVADDQVRADEGRSEHETYLVLEEDVDGWWEGRFRIPPLAGQSLRAHLEHRTSPRRAARRQTDPDSAGPGVQVDVVPDLPTNYLNRLGLALCEILEHLPSDAAGATPGRVGVNGFAVVVHVDEPALRTGIGTALLDTGAEISAGEARRLACNAGILPLVLSGDSIPLDLGREKRLFTRHQAIALSARHDSCAAEGCDRPFAWCELHHLCPWSEHGPTDLDNAVPLCGHHHRRIHDPLYLWHVNPDRSVTFQHRWPSRRTPRPGTHNPMSSHAA